MIVSPQNKESLILANIISTLSQLRLGGQPTAPLIISSLGDMTIDVYVDAAYTTLLFSENTTDNAENFSTVGDKTLYAIPDAKMNYTDDSLSLKYCQPTYYVIITIDEYTILKMTYNNRQNLLFKSVIVSTKKEPEFSTNDDSVIIVPVGSTEIPYPSAYFSHVFPEFNCYLQLTTPNLTDLSELDRINTAYLSQNIIRLALSKDTSRGKSCTFYDSAIDGTLVGSCDILPSTGMFFRGCVNVKCCYMSGNSIPGVISNPTW